VVARYRPARHLCRPPAIASHLNRGLRAGRRRARHPDRVLAPARRKRARHGRPQADPPAVTLRGPIRRSPRTGSAVRYAFSGLGLGWVARQNRHSATVAGVRSGEGKDALTRLDGGSRRPMSIWRCQGSGGTWPESERQAAGGRRDLATEIAGAVHGGSSAAVEGAAVAVVVLGACVIGGGKRPGPGSAPVARPAPSGCP